VVVKRDYLGNFDSADSTFMFDLPGTFTPVLSGCTVDGICRARGAVVDCCVCVQSRRVTEMLHSASSRLHSVCFTLCLHAIYYTTHATHTHACTTHPLSHPGSNQNIPQSASGSESEDEIDQIFKDSDASDKEEPENENVGFSRYCERSVRFSVCECDAAQHPIGGFGRQTPPLPAKNRKFTQSTQGGVRGVWVGLYTGCGCVCGGVCVGVCVCVCGVGCVCVCVCVWLTVPTVSVAAVSVFVCALCAFLHSHALLLFCNTAD